MNDASLRWLRVLSREPDYAAGVLLKGAGQGHPDAQAQLAQILLEGRGIEQDQALARTWFGIAAAAGHVAALNMLGRCHQMGWGGAVDLVQAARLYRAGARTGHDWSLYNYANMLARGWGVDIDRAAALRAYRQAADQGHAKAMNLVGRFYEEGWCVAADDQQAFGWYQRSALAGDFRGQCSYASMLLRQGRLGEAVTWLERSITSATVPFLQRMSQVLGLSNEVRVRAVGDRMHAEAARRLMQP